MKNYRITVNGVAYDVSVEEIQTDQMGTRRSGSYPLAMARYRKTRATMIMMKLPGFRNANPVWAANPCIASIIECI